MSKLTSFYEVRKGVRSIFWGWSRHAGQRRNRGLDGSRDLSRPRIPGHYIPRHRASSAELKVVAKAFVIRREPEKRVTDPIGVLPSEYIGIIWQRL